MQNKQELIGKYEYLNHNFFRRVDTSEVLRDLKQLDESEKVTVSEEEAKFLETFDFNCESDVTTALYLVSRTGWGYYLRDNNGEELKDLSEEFRELENRKRLIRAILFGYVVEKEKRYRISMLKARNYKNHAQILCEEDGKMFWCGEWYRFKTKFTRKELEEAGFGWVFSCEGIEIEEVKG